MRDCLLNRKEVEAETMQDNKDKDTFIKPKNRQRSNRRRANRGNTNRNHFSNSFEILDLETDSEDKHNTPTVDARQEGKEEPTKKGNEEGDCNNEVQMQERIEETEEETDMLTSEGGSEDLELEETLAMEGIDLPAIVESWRTRGIEAAPEEEIKKVNELFIAR